MSSQREPDILCADPHAEGQDAYNGRVLIQYYRQNQKIEQKDRKNEGKINQMINHQAQDKVPDQSIEAPQIRQIWDNSIILQVYHIESASESLKNIANFINYYYPNQSGIIRTQQRPETKALVEFLKYFDQEPQFYDSQKSMEQRDRVLKSWLNKEFKILITDQRIRAKKADCCFYVHFQFPLSINDYYKDISCLDNTQGRKHSILCYSSGPYQDQVEYLHKQTFMSTQIALPELFALQKYCHNLFQCRKLQALELFKDKFDPTLYQQLSDYFQSQQSIMTNCCDNCSRDPDATYTINLIKEAQSIHFILTQKGFMTESNLIKLLEGKLDRKEIPLYPEYYLGIFKNNPSIIIPLIWTLIHNNWIQQEIRFRIIPNDNRRYFACLFPKQAQNQCLTRLTFIDRDELSVMKYKNSVVKSKLDTTFQNQNQRMQIEEPNIQDLNQRPKHISLNSGQQLEAQQEIQIYFEQPKFGSGKWYPVIDINNEVDDVIIVLPKDEQFHLKFAHGFQQGTDDGITIIIQSTENHPCQPFDDDKFQIYCGPDEEISLNVFLDTRIRVIYTLKSIIFTYLGMFDNQEFQNLIKELNSLELLKRIIIDFNFEQEQLIGVQKLKYSLKGVKFTIITYKNSEAEIKQIADSLAFTQYQKQLASFNRPNIIYSIKYCDQEKQISKELESFITTQQATSLGIIFCQNEKDCQIVLVQLGDIARLGTVQSIHDGILDEWQINKSFTILVAQIDLNYIIPQWSCNFVLYYKYPKSVFDYYLSSRFAGYDQTLAYSIAFYSDETFSYHLEALCNQQMHDKLQSQLDQLQDIRSYSENTKLCRRQLLSLLLGQVNSIFNQIHNQTKDCKQCTYRENAFCDNCRLDTNLIKKIDMTNLAHQIVKGVESLPNKITESELIKILKGIKTGINTKTITDCQNTIFNLMGSFQSCILPLLYQLRANQLSSIKFEKQARSNKLKSYISFRQIQNIQTIEIEVSNMKDDQQEIKLQIEEGDVPVLQVQLEQQQAQMISQLIQFQGNSIQRSEKEMTSDQQSELINQSSNLNNIFPEQKNITAKIKSDKDTKNTDKKINKSAYKQSNSLNNYFSKKIKTEASNQLTANVPNTPANLFDLSKEI